MDPRPWEKILKNTFFLVAGRTLTRGLQFLLFIYAARMLGAESFGRFSAVYNLVGICMVFMDLGIASYLVQQASRHPEQTGELLGGVLKLNSVLILLGWLVIFLAGSWFKKLDQSLFLLVIMAVFSALETLVHNFFSVFQAAERMDFLARTIVIGNTIMVGIGFLFVTWIPSDLTLGLVFLFGVILRLILSMAWTLKKFTVPVWSSSIRYLWNLLKNGLPFALVSIFVTIYYYIDTLVLTVYASEAVVGYYNAAFRLMEGPLFLVGALTASLFPAISKLFAKDPGALKVLTTQAMNTATVIGLVSVIPVIFLSDFLVFHLFGSEYAPSARVLPILILSLLVIMPNTILGNTIRAMDQQRVSAWVTGMGAVFNVVANLLIIPTYSFIGAAWTTVATEVLIFIVSYFLIHRFIGHVLRLFTLIRLILLASFLVFLLWVLDLFGPISQIAGYIIGMPLALIVLRFVKWSDFKAMVRWFQSRRIRVT